MKQNYGFTEEQQEAVLGHCFENKSFFLKCKTKLKPEWFTFNIMLGTVFDQLCKSYDNYSQHIRSLEEFKQEGFFQELSPKERSDYFVLMNRCYGRIPQFSVDRLEKDLTGFLRTSMFKESIEESARKYNISGIDNAYNWTINKLNEIKKATFVDDKIALSFANPESWIKQHEARRGDAIPTGCKALDEALGGGLFRKETCAIMAPSNSGKTMNLITLARHSVINGKKVLFLIHEGYPEEIRMRILSSFLCIPTTWLFEWIKDNRSMYIKAASDIISKNLKFVPYIKTGAMFVEDVVDLVKKLQEEEIELTGKGFDIVIDDYPKKLKSRLRSGTKEGLYRAEIAEIYDTFNHLATELDVHCLVAAQTNRNGSKINNRKVESTTLLGMEEADESFGIIQNMANVITLNRDPDERKRNILRLNIVKSRNSITDVVINTRTEYSCALTFGDRNVILGDHQKHLKYGFLASYYQSDNQRGKVEDVDIQLMDIEQKSELMKEKEVNEAVKQPEKHKT